MCIQWKKLIFVQHGIVYLEESRQPNKYIIMSILRLHIFCKQYTQYKYSG